MTTGDRVTTRFDGRTGRRLGRLRWSPQRSATGRPLWRTAVGQELRTAEPARGRLFVEGAPGGGGRDRLWEIDLRTGRVIGSVAVPEFTVQAMAAVGDEIWLATAGGRAVVLAP